MNGYWCDKKKSAKVHRGNFHRKCRYTLVPLPFSLLVLLFLFEALSKWWHTNASAVVPLKCEMMWIHCKSMWVCTIMVAVRFIFLWNVRFVHDDSNVINKHILLTRGNHLRRGTYTVFALDDFEFDAPFGVPSLDCDRIARGPMLDDPSDEWFANFSNWIPLPK